MAAQEDRESIEPFLQALRARDGMLDALAWTWTEESSNGRREVASVHHLDRARVSYRNDGGAGSQHFWTDGRTVSTLILDAAIDGGALFVPNSGDQEFLSTSGLASMFGLWPYGMKAAEWAREGELVLPAGRALVGGRDCLQILWQPDPEHEGPFPTVFRFSFDDAESLLSLRLEALCPWPDDWSGGAAEEALVFQGTRFGVFQEWTCLEWQRFGGVALPVRGRTRVFDAPNGARRAEAGITVLLDTVKLGREVQGEEVPVAIPESALRFDPVLREVVPPPSVLREVYAKRLARCLQRAGDEFERRTGAGERAEEISSLCWRLSPCGNVAVALFLRSRGVDLPYAATIQPGFEDRSSAWLSIAEVLDLLKARGAAAAARFLRTEELQRMQVPFIARLPEGCPLASDEHYSLGVAHLDGLELIDPLLDVQHYRWDYVKECLPLGLEVLALAEDFRPPARRLWLLAAALPVLLLLLRRVWPRATAAAVLACGLAGLGFSACTGSPDSARRAAAAGGHALMIEGPSHLDLGGVEPGQEVIGRFPVRNATADQLRITDIVTSCGCLRAELAPMELAPNARGVLTLALVLLPNQSKFVEARVFSSDRFGQELAVVSIEATAKAGDVLIPDQESFDLGLCEPGGSFMRSAKVSFVSFSREEIELRAEAPEGWDVEIEALPDESAALESGLFAQAFRVFAFGAVPPDARPGATFAQDLVVERSGGAGAPIACRLSFHGRVECGYQAVPSSILLTRRSEPRPIEVLLRRLPASSAVIESIQFPPYLKVERREDPEGAALTVSAEFDHPSLEPGVWRNSAISIRMQGGGCAATTIPVAVRP